MIVQEENMGFIKILKHLTENPKCIATRKAFEKKKFIYMQEGSKIASEDFRCEALKVYKLCKRIKISSHIDMISFVEPRDIENLEPEDYVKQFTGYVTVGWMPTLEDITADDWFLISIKEEEE